MYRILFFLDEAYSLFPGGEAGPRFGGAELQLYTIADEVSKNSLFEVTWLFTDSKKYDVSLLNHPRMTILSRKPPFGRNIPILARYFNRKRCITRKELLKPYQACNPDVIISTMGSMAEDLRIESELAGAKTIFRVASDTDITIPRANTPEESEQILRDISNFDSVVVATNEQQIALNKFRTSPSVKIAKFTKMLTNIRSTSDSKHILWVASCQKLKQPWIFLELAKSFPDEQFVMIMPPIDENLSHTIRAQADKIDNLKLIPVQISRDKIAEYFAGSKLFVNTSKIEGFPNTFLEAFSVGVPVLSLSFNPDDMINAHGLGACADGSLSRLIEHCGTLLSDERLLEEKGKSACAYFKKNHNLEKIVQEWMSLIVETIEGRDDAD
ncbi:MAG: glycosyltransferase family 4 protein [Coriobacteriia bacterium]|nr:glycosyltransferase family 4 protein [Coriobacteriia bacterium]